MENFIFVHWIACEISISALKSYSDKNPFFTHSETNVDYLECK